MPQYMLLLYSNPAGWGTVSPEEMQKAIEKYVAWGRRLRMDGVLVASHKLADDAGKVIRGYSKDLRVMDGPYSETKEVLGGYYLIEAPNYAAAVKQCNDSPHLEYGGTVEVRQVDPLMGSPCAQP
jgi:hypothetical protein